ncbi:MAG: hypothetical protein WD848_07015 [Dehalococcoidia bacterium]
MLRFNGGRLRQYDQEVIAGMFLGGLHNCALFEVLMRSWATDSPLAETYIEGMMSVRWGGLAPGDM